MRRLRGWLWAAAAVWFLALALVAYGRSRAPAVPVLNPAEAASAADAGTQLAAAKAAKGTTNLGGTPAPAISLIDQFGRRRSLADFRGKAVVLAFIDSRATTLGPVTADALREAVAELPTAARARVALVAVNVNAAAHTVSDVRAWSQTHGMLHAWTFLTGSPAALRKVWKAYFVAVTDPGHDPNRVRHTAAVYILDSRGREAYLSITDPGATAGAQARPLAADLRQVLGVRAPRPLSAPTGATVLRAIAPGGGRGQVRIGGDGVQVVDFFATWCRACSVDLATLKAYAKLAPGAHLPGVVAVDLRLAEPSTAYVRTFAIAHGVSFPVALDATGKVTDAYRVTDLPTVILVGSGGKVLWRHTGIVSLAALQAGVRAHLPRG